MGLGRRGGGLSAAVVLAYLDFLSCGYIFTSDDTNDCLSLKMDLAMPPSSDPCACTCRFQRRGQVAGPRVVVRSARGGAFVRSPARICSA